MKAMVSSLHHFFIGELRSSRLARSRKDPQGHSRQFQLRLDGFHGDRHWSIRMARTEHRPSPNLQAGGYAYVYGQVKQKQQGATRKLLPSIQGREGGKWIVVDSGKVIVHALDERARDYYDLEGLWTFKASLNAPDRDLEKTIVKVRPRNNSKKPQHKIPQSNKSKKPAQSVSPS